MDAAAPPATDPLKTQALCRGTAQSWANKRLWVIGGDRVYTTCQPEHGVGDHLAGERARLAVDSRSFPLLSYDPGPAMAFATT